MLIVIVTVGMENKMPQTMENCLPHLWKTTCRLQKLESS